MAKVSTAKSIKAWKQANPDKVKALNKSWDKRFPIKRRLSHAKDIARSRGLPFELSNDQLINSWNQACHYCQASILNETGVGLDRINNTLGYTATNVLPCCGNCNYIRSDILTVAEMEVAMKAVLTYRQQEGDK